MPTNSNPHALRSAAVLAAGMALSAISLPAQQGSMSSLPATAPTQANALPAPIAAKPVPAADAIPRRRARVTYSAGLLDVEANNSSLNGILRDIAQLTGMKITGTVGDQRVFGKYGPAEPSTILATLLDGTGSNMLLRETAANAPTELILTPRTGAASPPSPSTSDSDEDETAPDASASPSTSTGLSLGQPPGTAVQMQPTTSGPRQIPAPANNVLGSPDNTTQSVSTLPTVQSVPTDSISTPSTAQPVSGIVDSTNPPPAGSTGFGSATPTQPAADTPKTPEQIYQQLQRLRQASQQQQGQSGSSTSTTPTTTPQ